MAEANWIAEAIDRINRHGGVVRASLIEVRGSAPREVGAMMLIDSTGIWQTIGGGALEFQIMRQARRLLAAPPAAAWHRELARIALGPDRGQCCGGVVRLLLEYFAAGELPVLNRLAALPPVADRPPILAHPLVAGPPLDAVPSGQPGLSADRGWFLAARERALRPLFLYGAGHLGRALAGHLALLDLDVHWIDLAPPRFPATMSAGVRRLIAADPALIAGHAPLETIHLVMTHDHALDQAICARVLGGPGFARLGLIGSHTKAARFRSRLTRAGIAPDRLARLVCPVGIAGITGKHPARIALSVAAAVAIWQQELDKQTNGQAMVAPSATQ